MKALRKVRAGNGHMEIVEVAVPRVSRDEVLMKVWAAGICGSDLLIEEDRHFYKAPVTLGHEFSGVAVEVGDSVEGVHYGDKIVANIETGSGWLGVTRDGAFASHMCVPASCIYRYEQSVLLDHACFTEPVVATLHSMQERNNVRAGDFVVVVGPGPMGLLGVQFAKMRGARSVALIGLRSDAERLRIGARTGADHILYSEDKPESAILELTNGRGADFVLESSASERGVQHAIDCARRSPEGSGGHGVISFISLWGGPIKINADAISLYQLSIQGSWSWDGPETWARAVDLISRGAFDLDPLLTGHYALEQWQEAFGNLRAQKDVKAFFYPNGTDWAR